MAASGSPITVDGGGSVKIKFKHSAYDQPGGGDEHHHKDNQHDQSPEVDRIEITNRPTIQIAPGEKVKVQIFLR